MVVAVVIAILAAVAIPSYSDYVTRGRLQAGAAVLKATRARMEVSFSDNRTYALAGGGCAVANFTDRDSQFAIACTITSSGQGFTLTATGAGPATGFKFGLNEAGIEQTLAVKTGWSAATLPVNRFILTRE